MLSKTKSVLLLLLFIFVYSINSYSQDKYSILGKVQIDNGESGGVVLIIYKDAVKIDKRNVPKSGRFNLKLDFGFDYVLEFTKESFVTKKVSISTFVPVDVLEANNRFPAFKFSISLFPAYKGLDLSVFDQPMGLIMYNKEIDDFDYDRDYADQIKDAILKITNQAKELALKLEQEREMLAKKYSSLIKNADKKFKADKYSESKELYLQANKLLPKETYPPTQIEKIDAILANNKLKNAKKDKLNKEYNALISSADTKLKAKQYQAAINDYTSALFLRKLDKYPTKQIEKIQDIISQNKKDAKEKALLLAQQKKVNKKYLLVIADADSEFNAKSYKLAMDLYFKAKNIKPSEKYPDKKISEIRALQKQAEQELAAARNNAINENYKEIIAKADSAYALKEYLSSLKLYKDALSVKANQEYPVSQISKIEKIISDLEIKKLAEEQLLADQKFTNEKYNSLIAKADKYFSSEDYKDALLFYVKAKNVKPTETYPDTQIDKINKRQEDIVNAQLLAKQTGIDDQYDAAIEKADNYLKSEDYKKSIKYYKEAIIIKAKKKYPKDQILHIDNLLISKDKKDAEDARELLANKDKSQKYKQAIYAADRFFNKKKYLQAKNKYKLAHEIDDKKEYPPKRIEEIDSIIDKLALLAKDKQEELDALKNKNNKYDEFIYQADRLLSVKKYNKSIDTYTQALSVKKNEKYPKSQIRKIKQILAKLDLDLANEQKTMAKNKDIDQRYSSFISKADGLFSAKDYNESKDTYILALNVKPKDKYAQKRIREINTILSEHKMFKLKKERNDKEYNEQIAKAKVNFDNKEYKISKFYYNKALLIKAKDEFCLEKIKEIDNILKSLKSQEKTPVDIAKPKLNDYQERMFAEILAKADKAFKNNKLGVASFFYRKCVSIKNDDYAKAQMFKINEKWRNNKLAEIQKKYALWVEKGDDQMKNKNYMFARFNYNKALEINPSEEYPKSQIVEITKLLRDNKQNKHLTDYHKLISKGDDSFAKGKISLARFYYNKAMKLMPEKDTARKKIQAMDSKTTDK